MTSIPAGAKVAAPVRFSLASADTLRAGQPVTIWAVFEAGRDLPHAEMRVANPAEWQILDGGTFWTGALKAGQRVELQFRAVPLTDQPSPIEALLAVPGFSETRAKLGAERFGRNFPERVSALREIESKDEAPAKRLALQADPADGVQPETSLEPTVPGEPQEMPERVALKADRKKAAVNVRATGRFTFDDDNGIRRGVRRGTVEMVNRNDAPFPDEVCASGLTDNDGNFDLTGNCGDLFDGPDIRVRLVLNNNIVMVKPDNIFAGNFVFNSAVRNNVGAGTQNFNTLVITNRADAVQAHNLIMRAQQFMASQGETMPKVNVLLDTPSGSRYSGFFSDLFLSPGIPFDNEFTVYHEYGHHILVKLAESPAPDYDNGICDDPSPGHCIFGPENGDIAWTEGWPNFFGVVLHERHNEADGYGVSPLLNFFDVETYARPFDFPGLEAQTEGIIAAILWDIVDADDDDQLGDGAGRRDRLNMTFADTWQVIRNFDPSSDLFHNHPTSIHEFWEGMREFHPESINLVSEVYGEHNIAKPLPELNVAALGNGPGTINRGASFTVSNSIDNDGAIVANSAFTVRFELVTGRSRVTLGTRNVGANLAAGGRSTQTTTLTIPALAATGTYQLRACADSGFAVPESNETNNCRTTAATVTVR